MEYKVIRDRINELHFKYQQHVFSPEKFACLSMDEWDELKELYNKRLQFPEYNFELSKVEIYIDQFDSL